jgi:hypothetical protein
VLGQLTVRRAYYYCRRCGAGLCPFDQAAGLTAKNLTPGLERLATLAGGVSDGFEKAGELLDEMAGAHLSESTMQRTAEAAGQRLGELQEQGQTFGPRRLWDWHLDALGRRIAYLGLDATGVPQQGPEGAAAPGRMAYVGTVYNTCPEWLWPRDGKPRPRMQARYVCGLYGLAEMGPLLRRQAAHVGVEQADLWLALTDGGNGLEDFMRTNFPLVTVVILDFWHAAEYLGDLAKALHPRDEDQAKAQTAAWCQLLKEEGGATTLAVLQEWEWPERQSKELREQRERVQEYFGNNLHRMEYPEYVAEGWEIGSGPVESACKTVVNQRLKLAGMRWGEDGADAMCHVRALYRGEKGQWEAFWNRDFTN